MLTTDLDGTLLNRAQQVSARDWQTLTTLGDDGVVRVIATGRSLYSARKVLSDELPIDYLVFSSGAGAIDWASGELVFAHTMPVDTVRRAHLELCAASCDFMMQRVVPDTHQFAWSRNSVRPNPDFERRIAIYEEHAVELVGDNLGPTSQFVVVCTEAEGLLLVPSLRALLPDCNVVRTTSPLDGHSMWIEIFPAGISKASGCADLAGRHQVEVADVMGIGNDFNDLDLLAWVGHAFVVENSPQELRERFEVVASHEDSGLSDSVARWRARRER